MKRQRGRGRRPGGGGGGGNHQHNNHQPNRTMESNGPDTKVRGPAAHIHERYLQLARDAASSGDRVLSENYLQHADHYFRLVRLMQPAAPPPQQERFSSHADFESDEDGPQENGGAEEGAPGAENGAEASDAEASEGQRAHDRDSDPRRRRGRRNRFRPGGGEGEAVEAEREHRRERTDNEEGVRRDRPPRERDERRTREPSDDASGPEGFSSGPKPAFLRD